MPEDKSGFVATMLEHKPLHDPPSEADLLERWWGVSFQSGDLEYYLRATKERMLKSIKKLREYESKETCNCKSCNKSKE
jgi:hypothetical protein